MPRLGVWYLLVAAWITAELQLVGLAAIKQTPLSLASVAIGAVLLAMTAALKPHG